MSELSMEAYNEGKEHNTYNAVALDRAKAFIKTIIPKTDVGIPLALTKLINFNNATLQLSKNYCPRCGENLELYRDGC